MDEVAGTWGTEWSAVEIEISMEMGMGMGPERRVGARATEEIECDLGLVKELVPELQRESRVGAANNGVGVISKSANCSLNCVASMGVNWKSTLTEYRKSLNTLEISLSRRWSLG